MGQEISVKDERWEADGLRFRMWCHDPYYILLVAGFVDEHAARDFVGNVRAGLMWVLVHMGITALGIHGLQESTYFPDSGEMVLQVRIRQAAMRPMPNRTHYRR